MKIQSVLDPIYLVSDGVRLNSNTANPSFNCTELCLTRDNAPVFYRKIKNWYETTGDGSKLIYEGLFRPHYLTLASLVYNKIVLAFDNQLSNSQTTTYTALVLNMIELSGSMNQYIPITNRQVHDMWMLTISKHDPQHKACVPFNSLTKPVQDLDQPYTDKLNKIAKDLYTNLMNIKLNDSVWYFGDHHA